MIRWGNAFAVVSDTPVHSAPSRAHNRAGLSSRFQNLWCDLRFKCSFKYYSWRESILPLLKPYLFCLLFVFKMWIEGWCQIFSGNNSWTQVLLNLKLSFLSSFALLKLWRITVNITDALLTCREKFPTLNLNLF